MKQILIRLYLAFSLSLGYQTVKKNMLSYRIIGFIYGMVTRCGLQSTPHQIVLGFSIKSL